jgi:hypothetical protein
MGTKLKKILKLILIITGIIIFILYLVFRFFLDLKMSDAKVEEYFSAETIKPAFHFYEAEGHTMHYVDIGDKSKPVIIFVHGSPGSWDAFAAYFKDPEMLLNFRMISVDRIGYGKSDPGQPESSLWLQSALIKPILDQIPMEIPSYLSWDIPMADQWPIAWRWITPAK